MRAKTSNLALHLLSLALLVGLPVSGEPPGTVEVPASIVAQNVPAIAKAAAEDLLPYENIRTAQFSDWHPSERRILIRTRFAESVQLHEVAFPLGDRSQLTFHREPVTNGSYRPGRPEQVLYTLNEGGAENFQFFLLDKKSGKARRLSDGEHRYIAPVFSPSGKLLAYGSNARNGRDFDVYVMDPDNPESERRVAQVSGQWAPLSWSRDESRLLLGEGISVNESYLHQVEIATGKLAALTPRAKPGEPTVAYQGGEWSPDGKAVYTVSDQGSEFLRLVRLDPGTGAVTPLSANIPWDVEGFDLSDDGSLVAFAVNEDGFSSLHLLETASGKERPVPALPQGVANGLTFRPGAHEVAFILSWARSPSDVYTYDADSGRLERWTASEVGGLDPASFVLPQLVRFKSFDGRSIPAFVYRPDAAKFPGKRPVYVNIHGGPEGQARPNFLQSNNYLPSELGVVLVVPNVRGSSGYGKGYLKLDNGMLREDSVKDIGALLDWIASQPDLDAARVMVGGGSYGGYMVLASLTHYNDRLCCAFDTVGVSNFVTFLENTQEYRRDLRRVEYGDERDPKMRAFLESIAPARHADRIKRPLLVAQGANDPRVPLSESDQIVAAVSANGVPVWYVVAKDEGHGFQKKTNTDYLRAVLFEFIRRHLVP